MAGFGGSLSRTVATGGNWEAPCHSLQFPEFGALALSMRRRRRYVSSDSREKQNGGALQTGLMAFVQSSSRPVAGLGVAVTRKHKRDAVRLISGW